MNEVILLLTHEYAMALYGVLGWQLLQGVYQKNNHIGEHLADVLKSMGWAGLIVIFDDEIIAQFNKFAEIDYDVMPKYGYTIAGFAIDGILNFFKK